MASRISRTRSTDSDAAAPHAEITKVEYADSSAATIRSSSTTARPYSAWTGFTGTQSVCSERRTASQTSAIFSGRTAFQKWPGRSPGFTSGKPNHWLLRRCLSSLSQCQATAAAAEAEARLQGSYSDEQSRKCSIHHIQAERKRRKLQNESFVELRRLLPKTNKKDKAFVLRHTIDYINNLVSENQQLEECSRQLGEKIRQQDEEIARLKASTRSVQEP